MISKDSFSITVPWPPRYGNSLDNYGLWERRISTSTANPQPGGPRSLRQLAQNLSRVGVRSAGVLMDLDRDAEYVGEVYIDFKWFESPVKPMDQFSGKCI